MRLKIQTWQYNNYSQYQHKPTMILNNRILSYKDGIMLNWKIVSMGSLDCKVILEKKYNLSSRNFQRDIMLLNLPWGSFLLLKHKKNLIIIFWLNI